MNFIETLPKRKLTRPTAGAEGLFERGRDDALKRAFSLPLPSRA
jgi:hypothetical protein